MSNVSSSIGLVVLAAFGLAPSACFCQVDRELLDQVKFELKSVRLSDQIGLHVSVDEFTERSVHNIKKNYAPGLLEKLKKLGQDPAKSETKREIFLLGEKIASRLPALDGKSSVVFASNERYGFTVRGDADKGWSLVELLNTKEMAESPEKSDLVRAARNIVPGSDTFLGEIASLGDYLESPNTVVSSIGKPAGSPEGLVRLEFEMTRKDESRPYLRLVKSAYANLDSTRGFSIIESGGTLIDENGGELSAHKVNYEYNDVASRLVTGMLHEFRLRDEPTSSKSVIRRRTETVDRKFSDLSRFELSGYGLPEPELGQGYGRVFGLVCAGAFLFAVGLYLKTRSNKKS